MIGFLIGIGLLRPQPAAAARAVATLLTEGGGALLLESGNSLLMEG